MRVFFVGLAGASYSECSPRFMPRPGGGARFSEFAMAAVTERWVLGVFAATEKQALGFVHGDFHWLEPAALVTAVAKGLLGGFPATAPVIGSGFHVDDAGAGLRYGGLAHLLFPQRYICE